jgi:hypothetical protein
MLATLQRTHPRTWNSSFFEGVHAARPDTTHDGPLDIECGTNSHLRATNKDAILRLESAVLASSSSSIDRGRLAQDALGQTAFLPGDVV